MNTIFHALLSDPCAGFTAAVVTYVLGKLAITGRERLQKFGAALGGAAFLGVVWHGVYAVKRPDVLGLAVKALTLGFATLGVSWIVLALAAFLHETLVLAPAAAMRERARRRREEAWRIQEAVRLAREAEIQRLEADERKIEEERRKREEYERSRPPPPEELAALARLRYERRILLLEASPLDEVELAAARQLAKQQYLREIGEIMK